MAAGLGLACLRVDAGAFDREWGQSVSPHANTGHLKGHWDVSETVVKPVILCGGGGTRLWPMSNPSTPKQFLQLTGTLSMLEETAERVSTSSVRTLRFSDLLAVGSKRHEAMLREHLTDAKLLLEPFGRNSAAAVIASALVSQPDDLLLILPSDHHIAFPEKFHEAIAIGTSHAEAGHVITFGITPTFPSTGYGYIELESGNAPIRKAERFVEKPDKATACEYIRTERYVWNAGIFLFKASAMIEAFAAHAPDILTAVKASLPANPADAINAGALTLDPENFDSCPSISVDYAIMEKVKPIYGVPVDMGWSDVGDYKALWDLLPKDDSGNVLVGPVTAVDCENCYIRSESDPVSVAGLKGAVVVAMDGRTMICDMEDAQKVKALAQLAQG
ncbi:mannose-1-phosphate guanylyltransferase [Henriciella sp. AS95]|uniref:mannose-1-phosphate guanylyltransferase n=1 Tax=Henriciella sp. AS95 TaxID=3135782 RepID=UPI00316B73E2